MSAAPSATEYADAPEPRSKVKLILNAKGDVQVEITAVADEEPGLLEEARQRAVAAFNALRREYPRQAS